jgi:hypothetical protein
MARSAIPDFGTEYPEYEYKAWPKYVGMDADGEALIAKDKAQFDELKELAAYPKVLGKDKSGNELVAQNPRDEAWLKAKVVHAAIEAAEPVNALTDKPSKKKAA